MGKIKGFLWRQLKELENAFAALLRSVFLILLISFIVWLCGGRPDLYGSLQKIVSNLVVIKMEPRSELYTQFAHEYGLGKYGESATIPNGGILTIEESEKPIWIGIKNNENISLENVLFKIYLPDSVVPINEEEWIKGWQPVDTKTGKGFFAQFKDNIQPGRGAHFDLPIQVRFLRPGDYTIFYVYCCDNFFPKKGHFTIRVLGNKG